MKPLTALGSGLAGACAVSLLHETVRRIVPEAPRMDLLGMNAITKTLKATDQKVPSNKKLYTWALAGDIFSNSIYYSLTGLGKGKNAWVRGTALGLAAGIGAVVLPKPLGLNEKHSNKTLTMQLMTIGLYVAGALVTTAVMRIMENKKLKQKEVWEERLMTSAMG